VWLVWIRTVIEHWSVDGAAGDAAVARRVPPPVPPGALWGCAVAAIVVVAHDRPRRARPVARALLRGRAVLSSGEVRGCVGLDGVNALSGARGGRVGGFLGARALGAFPARRGRGAARALGGRCALGGGRLRAVGDSSRRCFTAAAGVPAAGGDRCGGRSACAGRGAAAGPCHVMERHPAPAGVAQEDSYLVDPASSHMLVSKIKPCMCKYKLVCTVKLRMAH
jgi:hypothetical protein